MQKCKEPSGFFAKITKATQGEKEGLMTPTSNSSSIDYFINNYSCKL